ncbi:insulin gene enhancer protein isl-2b [Clonorchis sinensis]|uniref:Insulin gene enhancer protein isl-2b n=1 Tax=Clonorchis sinensis TaxID=79923 RepID=G7YUM0_CLOSI|nr:insulin gene enhancer protein isl-2b [Clonorchis sinensis]
MVFRVRSRAFHLDCFRCAICERLIQPGEEIAFEADRVCCLSHIQTHGPGVKPQPTKEPAMITFDQTIKFEMEDVLRSKELRPGKRPLEIGTTSDCATLNAYIPSSPPVVRRNQALLPSLLLNRSDHLKSAEVVELDEGAVYEDLCTVSEERRKKPTDRLPKFNETEFPDAFCPSSPSCRPNSSGSSLGVAIRDADSPLTASSELSHDDEGSLLGLTNMSHGQGESGLNSLNGPGTLFAGGGTPLSHGYGSTPVGICGGSRTGSGSSSSGTSVTGGCGDEVVHSVSVTRVGGLRNGKSGGSKRSKDQKTTRVRTVLNEKQLHTLRTCYAANPRPDALMKEQLVEMTSLSPRVIRVWFQNKRCKDKKRQILLKQMEQHQQNGGRPGHLHGISMIASSPVRNDPNMLCSSTGIDVQQVLGPYWKSPPSSEHPPRTGIHCSVFKPSSPYAHPIQSKLNRSASPCLSAMMNAHGLNGPGNETPVCYPTNLSALGNLMTSFASAASGSNVSPVSNTSFTSTVQSPTHADRSRFGLMAPQAGTPVLPPGFPEDQHSQPPIAAFQQLVSNFDTTDSPTVHIPGGSILPNPVCFSNNEFPKAPSLPTQSMSCDNVLFSSLTSQLQPNLSIPPSSRIEVTGLDNLPCPSATPSSVGFSNLNNIPLFNAPPLAAATLPPLSPNTVTLNMLSSSPQQTTHYAMGSYLHGQVGLITSSSRASLST